MSGMYNKRDGFVITPLKMNAYEEALIGALFDQQVDSEVKEIEDKIKEEKLLRNMCMVKVCLYPIQYPLTRIFLGKILAQDVSHCNKLYWKYLKKKISTKQFKKELNESLKKVAATK